MGLAPVGGRRRWFATTRNAVVSLFCCSVPITDAAAETIYVDGSVAQSGDGSSEAQALKTIDECAQVAAAGDTCLIASGTYRETVWPELSDAVIAEYGNEAGAPV